MDLNPVRAGLVERAVEYRWSSASARVNGRDEWSLLDRKNWRNVSTNSDWADALRDPLMEAGKMAWLRKATRTVRWAQSVGP